MATTETTGQGDEILSEFLERETQRISFCDPNHVVSGGKSAPLLPEHLAHEALDPVALMRTADLPRYGDPQPRRLQRIGLGS